jgi:hypothetical protein
MNKGYLVPGGYRRCENCKQFFRAHDFWLNKTFNACHKTGLEVPLDGLCCHWRPAETLTLTEMVARAGRTRIRPATALREGSHYTK